MQTEMDALHEASLAVMRKAEQTKAGMEAFRTWLMANAQTLEDNHRQRQADAQAAHDTLIAALGEAMARVDELLGGSNDNDKA